MPAPKGKYPEDSTFGRRIRERALEKRMVGRYIAEKFLERGVTAFISDGSSTLYVGLALYRKALEWKDSDPFRGDIYTNNLALANEYPLWDLPPDRKIPDVHVSIASGNVVTDLMMVSGIDAQAYSKIRAEASDCVIISVRNLFGDRGPTGRERESLEIKRSALEGAKNKKIIFVADYTKLLEVYNTRVMPLIYDSKTKWEEVMCRDSTYVISTKPPDSTKKTLGHEVTQAERRRYQRNRDFLHSNMNTDDYGREKQDYEKRFIEVDTSLRNKKGT